jgi:hypothetical protein
MPQVESKEKDSLHALILRISVQRSWLNREERKHPTVIGNSVGDILFFTHTTIFIVCPIFFWLIPCALFIDQNKSELCMILERIQKRTITYAPILSPHPPIYAHPGTPLRASALRGPL